MNKKKTGASSGRKLTKGELVFTGVNRLILAIAGIVTLAPFVYVFFISLMPEIAAR